MAKPKQNPVPSAPGKNKRKKKNQENVNPITEDDWIVVKKQKVTILIPSLPSKARFVMPNVVVQEMPTKTSSQVVVLALEKSGCEPEKSISLAPEQTVPPADNEVVHLVVPNSTSEEPMSLSHRGGSGNSHSFGDGKAVGVGQARNVSKRTMACVGSGVFLDRRMRASYLEKKLKRVGGLENWLLSLGLGCFTKVFQKQRVHKFHLANLTMKKLEDMGVYAVGPRRKLLHAIDCLCEPHCFQHVMIVGSGAFLDRRIVSYLEIKLKRPGGLELGLGCFAKLFQKQRVHKFHLANLTMKKLEDMGVRAVGP